MHPRDRTSYLFLLFLLVSLTGFALLLRFPDSPVVEWGREHRWTAPLASWIQQRYLPRPPVAGGGEREVPGAGKAEIRVDAESVEAIGARPEIWVPAGSTLLAEPRPGAPPVARVEAISNLSLLERRGDWARVWRSGVSGWLRAPEEKAAGVPPLGSAPASTGPLPGREPDPALLARARRLLGAEAARPRRLGPYRLHTDVADRGLLDFLDRVASGVEETYERRFGVAPVDRPREAVVLFRDAAAYRSYQGFEERLAALPSVGHAGGGIAALYVGGEPPTEVASTLVHELAHLLNRRALGPALPPWLEEGIADDLAGSRLTADGRLAAGSLGGRELRRGLWLELTGAVAAASLLARTAREGRLPPLAELTRLDWDAFVAPGVRQQRYAQSAFFVRFLLSGLDPGLEDGFRRWLAAVRAGGSTRADSLAAALGVGFAELDVRYRAWLELAGRERAGPLAG